MNTIIASRLTALLQTAQQMCASKNAHSETTAAARTGYKGYENGLHDQGHLVTSAWQLAWASATGMRHFAHSGGCEDNCQVFAADADGAVNLAVADGVSQGAHGALAAQTAAETVVRAPAFGLHDAAVYQQVLQQADAAVQDSLQVITHNRGASTLACAWLGQDGRGFINRVGDCRVYAWQADHDAGSAAAPSLQAHSLLPDQSYGEMGEAPPGVHPDNPARMLGVGALGKPEVLPIQVPLGAGLILCSDGLHDVMPAQAWSQALSPLHALPPCTNTTQTGQALNQLQALAVQLVRSAQARGSDDDVSVIIARRVR